MICRLIDNGKQFLVTLKFSILSIFISLLLTTTILIIIIINIRFANELSYISFQMMKYASSEVERELSFAIRPAKNAAQFTVSLLEQNVLSVNEAQLVPYTFNLEKNLPLVKRIFWADENGNYIAALREKNNTISSEIYLKNKSITTRKMIVRDKLGTVIKEMTSTDANFDPRTMSWYRDMKAKKKFMWTDVHFFHTGLSKEQGITALFPVFYKNGDFQGLIGFNITLDYLSQFMTRQQISTNGYSFIINKNENLIAFPKRYPFTLSSTTSQLINTHEIGLPIIDQSFDFYKEKNKNFFTLKINNNEYLMTYNPIKELQGFDWYIGVVMPRSDITKPLQEMNFMTLGISFFILLLGISLVSNLVTKIVKPIKLLVKETKKIREFELNEDIRLRSRIKEVVLLKNSLQSMKRGLRHFQKYVPKILVHQLIESGEDLRVGGVRKELVVLFSDIKNFAAIAEHMDPNQLMIQLCEYFEALSQIIIAEKGTIDKYIGDSIMAFWGAPLPEQNSCHRAAQAALQCQIKLMALNQKWETEGKPHFVTRIGIHVGDAIVGNLGSSERFNYTAIGDTINITSRLEEINKSYRTHIIVSDAVYQQIKQDFALRMVDEVHIKGRKEAITIYELLAENSQTLPYDYDAYQIQFSEAFKAYKQKNWTDALFYFNACLKIYPEDTLAPIFIVRCKQYDQD